MKLSGVLTEVATAIAAIFWLAYLPIHVQFAAMLAAMAFSCIEYTWYATTTEDKDGEVHFTPFHATCRGGHTTWAQFWANVLYTPVLLYAYRAFVPSACLRVALFPFNIWMLEIVEGYALMFIFGKNIAWTYNTADAYCHGNIRLGFWKLWLGLGLLLEIVGYNALDSWGRSLSTISSVYPVLLLLVLATWRSVNK